MGIESGTYISDLVITNPLGSDDRVSADDHLRLLKTLIKNTFPELTGAMTATHVELNKLDGFTGSTTNLNLVSARTLASTDDVIDNFPAGTLMTFQQTAAPSGWTKETTHDNKAFRVVSGTAGSGGSSNFSTVFGKSATDSHTLIEAEVPAHDHGAAGDHKHTLHMVSGGNGGGRVGLSRTSNKKIENDSDLDVGTEGDHTHTSFGGSGGHVHNMDIRVRYVDLIIASKD